MNGSFTTATIAAAAVGVNSTVLSSVVAATVSTAMNVTGGSADPDVQEFPCRADTPTAVQMFHDQTKTGLGLIGLYTVCLVVTFAIYFEELSFLIRNFQPGPRLTKTIWILSFFPGFSMTSYIAILVPRSGVLCGLVSNVFFVSCLYQFLGLMEGYLGGKRVMWAVIGESRQMALNVPPCCCCCLCLPKPTLNRRNYKRIAILISQVAVVRPILGFIAAVLWTNGSYIPGNLLPNNGFLYLAIVNLISTMLAMWGLMIMKAATRPDLEERFALTGKFACIQLSLICIGVTNLIVGLLVTTNIIKCTQIYPSKARAETIAHCVFVTIMLPLAIIARFFYRRMSDAAGVGVNEDDKTFAPTNVIVSPDDVEIRHHQQQDVDNGNIHKSDAV